MKIKIAFGTLLAQFLCLVTSAQAQQVFDRIRFAEFQPELYVRPFGKDAAWNRKIEGIPLHKESAKWVERLWTLSPAARPGNFNLGGFKDYSFPVYDARKATTEVEVKSKNPDWGNLQGQTIPWNPEWQAAKGSDGQVIVLDWETGREWNLWQVKLKGKSLVIGNGSLVSGDFRTKEDGFRPSRGCGIQYLAMLTRPEEIMKGKIEHALSMPIKNPNSKIFLPPATKTDGDKFGIPNGVPEGMRFALRVTDEEIEQWITSLPKEFDQSTRYSAKVIAVALRDYGWIITDNSGGAFFQFEYEGTAGDKWKALGLGSKKIRNKEYPQDLLDGLITQERIYAVVSSDQYPP